MLTYILRRLLTMIPTIVLVSMVSFFIILLIPGDPAAAILGESADRVTVAKLRKEMGLDRPLYEQYLSWAGGALRGEFGRSTMNRQPVGEAIAQRLPVTLELAILGMVAALAVGIPLGIISATRRNSFVDLFTSALAMVGIAMPNFWLGILLVLVFALGLHWLPVSGFEPLTKDPLANLQSMAMPAIATGAGAAAVIMRMVRASLLEVQAQEYVTTAKAKGLPKFLILRRHSLRNALIPTVTVVGIQFGRLLGGAVIVETIFALPGIGRLAVNSILSRDFPVLQAVVLLMAVGVLFSNLIVDVLYGYLEPRIRHA